MTPNEKELQGVQKSVFEDLPVADGGLGGAIDLARQGGYNDTSGEWIYHAPSAQHRWRAFRAGWKAARKTAHHEMHTPTPTGPTPTVLQLSDERIQTLVANLREADDFSQFSDIQSAVVAANLRELLGLLTATGPIPPVAQPSNEATFLERCCAVRGINPEGNDGTLLRRIIDWEIRVAEYQAIEAAKPAVNAALYATGCSPHERRINDQITAALIAWGSVDVDNKINRENMSRALLAANAQAPVATPGCYPVGVIQDAIASRIPREFSAWQKWPGTRVLADAVIDALKIRSLSLAAPAQPAVASVADYLTAQGKEAQAIEAAKPTVNAALYPGAPLK